MTESATDKAAAVSAEAPTLELLANPREERIVLVESESELVDAVAVLQKSSGWFAIDSERASGFKYSQRAYLVQVKRENSPIFLIDPVAISPELEPDAFAPLADLLSQDTWILHAATQDIPCLNELGLRPTRLFDTELAGRLAGLSRVGLGAMVERFLSVRLAKEHSAVDWSVRPLSRDWITYAALDVDVLHELVDGIQAELRRQSKLEFAEQEFANLLNFRPKPQKIDRWRTISGLHEVKNQRGLAIARSLWTAREELAKKLDVSPGRLLPDSSISSVAKNPLTSRSALAESKTFIGRASRTYLDTWWGALQNGAETKDLPPLRIPNDGIPNHRSWPQRFPEAEARLQALKQVVSAQAEELAMPIENLLTPDYLRALAWQKLEAVTVESVSEKLAELGARPWQIELLCANFVSALTTIATDED